MSTLDAAHHGSIARRPKRPVEVESEDEELAEVESILGVICLHQFTWNLRIDWWCRPFSEYQPSGLGVLCVLSAGRLGTPVWVIFKR